VAGAGGAAGAVLGGVLTAEISWRWVLFVNIPIGTATAVAALVYLTEAKRGQRDENTPKLDIAGAITVTAGFGDPHLRHRRDRHPCLGFELHVVDLGRGGSAPGYLRSHPAEGRLHAACSIPTVSLEVS